MSGFRTIFVDQVQHVSLRNGVARLSFGVVDAEGKPQETVTLAMPMGSVPQTHATLTNFLEKIAEEMRKQAEQRASGAPVAEPAIGDARPAPAAAGGVPPDGSFRFG